MDTIHDTLTLLRTRIFDAIGIVRQLVLVDAGGTAESSNGYQRLTDANQRSHVNIMIFKLIVTVNKPLRYLVTVFEHTLYVEFQSFLRLLIKFIRSIGSKDHCSWHVISELSGEILVAPCNIYPNLFHIAIILGYIIFKAG